MSFSSYIRLIVWNSRGVSEKLTSSTVVLIMTNWEDPADDKRMKDATNKLGGLVPKEAHSLDLLVNFTYLNYANKDQSVYEQSLTPEDLAKMLRIRDKYDRSAIFRTLWKGGYKLPETPAARGASKDEL